MAKNLLIVESPAKAKTIEGYLGKDFTVKSSYGHIRDLVKSEDAIDIKNNFEQKYEVPADKKQVVSELKTWFGSPPMRTARGKPFPGTCSIP
jgi:DNA topoisomerase-1